MNQPDRIVIVGGGVTGLAAAHAAIARGRDLGRPINVTVLERSARFGGNIVTQRVEGFVLDGGPDSWVASKPHATALAHELGLGSALVGTNAAMRRYFIAWAGRLHAVPEGLVLGVPTRLAPLARSSLFSWKGKARMALEPFIVARRFEGDEDESIADFAARRLGREAADRLVAPLLGGISAGDAADLSVRASFPQLVAMERDHGSLVMGMRAAARARAAASKGDGAPASAFVSLEGGVEPLVVALQQRLRADGATLRSGAEVRSIAHVDRGFSIDLNEGERIEADAIILALPAPRAARLLASLGSANDVSSALGAVRYGSTATVFLAYRRDELAHPLDGVGFVVPRGLGRPILASTWVSSKWSGRAPPGHALVRVFFGGARGEEVLSKSDAQLAEIALAELRVLMACDARPLWSRVFRFDSASAQMRVGHVAMIRSVRERLAAIAPRLRVAGGGYDGVGIPDCVRQGQEAARSLIEGAP